MSTSPESSRRLAAVWFADIVGYTTLSHTDEDGAILVVEAFQRLAAEIVPEYSGRVVKYVGDAALAEFASTDGAIRSALALVERFHDDPTARSRGMAIRVGVNVGEVISAKDGDIYGDGVNLASRLHDQAQPGQVVASEAAHAQIRQRPVFKTEALGEKAVKGVAASVRIFAVTLIDTDAEVVGGPPEVKEPASVASREQLRSRSRLKWLIPVALAGIVISTAFWFSSGKVAVDRATYPVVEGGLEVGGAITLEFTGAIDPATATSQNIRLVDAQGVTVPAEVSLDSDEMSVSISPRNPLAYGAMYTLVVSDSLTGASGRAVQGPGGNGTGASLVISTQAIPAGVGPPRLTPADDFDPGMVPAAGPIRVRFSEPISPTTASAGGVRLATADGQPVEAALLFTDGNREVRIEPASPLGAGGRYVVRIDSTLTGATGLVALADSLALSVVPRRAAATAAARPAPTPRAAGPGTLTVTVVPAAAQPFVKVVIDGDTVGTPPLRGLSLSEGRSHSVVVVGVPELSAFVLPVFRESVTVRAGQAVNLAAEISAFGSIDVVSQPSGAVFVDGRQVGRTPLAGYPVLAGIIHRLEIRPSPADQDLYDPFTTEFRVDALEWRSLGRLVLPPKGN